MTITMKDIFAFPFNVMSVVFVGTAYPFVLAASMIGRCWIKDLADKFEEERKNIIKEDNT